MNKLKIWHDGNPAHAQISSVDENGRETTLETVLSIEFSSQADADTRLYLGMRSGNVLEIEIPVDGAAVTRLHELEAGWTSRIVGRAPIEWTPEQLQKIRDLPRAANYAVLCDADGPGVADLRAALDAIPSGVDAPLWLEPVLAAAYRVTGTPTVITGSPTRLLIVDPDTGVVKEFGLRKAQTEAAGALDSEALSEMAQRCADSEDEHDRSVAPGQQPILTLEDP